MEIIIKKSNKKYPKALHCCNPSVHDVIGKKDYSLSLFSPPSILHHHRMHIEWMPVCVSPFPTHCSLNSPAKSLAIWIANNNNNAKK